MAGQITLKNDSIDRLLFSDFNAGEGGIPFEAKWVDANSTAHMSTGDFKSVGIGVQIQEGGRWLGGEPQNEPYVKPGGTFRFVMRKEVS